MCRMAANPGALDPKSAPKHTTWTKSGIHGRRSTELVPEESVWSPWWSGRPRAFCAYLRSTLHSPYRRPLRPPCKAAKLQTCSMLPWRTPRTLEQRVVGQLPPCYPKTWHKTRRLGPRTCSLLAFSSTKQQTALTVPCPCGCWVPAGLPQWNSLGSRSWSDSPGWTSSK